VLNLPTVTLCAVDCTPRLSWALKALRHCMQQARFGDAIICADRASMEGQDLPPGLRWIEIERLHSIEAYSRFMIKGLVPHVATDHVLVVQWDGYILHPAAWRAEFLEVDYIGAPWNHLPGPHVVGNGGFSLRSRRLLDALADSAIEPAHPEDICICRTHRTRLEAMGIRFATPELARQFAVEDDPMSAEVFGFHGPAQLPWVMSPQDTLALVESLPPDAVLAFFFRGLLRELTQAAREKPSLQPALRALQGLIHRGIDAMDGPTSLSSRGLRFYKALIRHGQYEAAARLLRVRRVARAKPWLEPMLWLRLQGRAITRRRRT
jgi:hypothetical protein